MATKLQSLDISFAQSPQLRNIEIGSLRAEVKLLVAAVLRNNTRQGLRCQLPV